MSLGKKRKETVCIALITEDAEAEDKEAKLVKESEERVQKRISEQEALVDVLKTRQRKEEEEAEAAYEGSLPAAGRPPAPATPECPVS